MGFPLDKPSVPNKKVVCHCKLKDANTLFDAIVITAAAMDVFIALSYLTNMSISVSKTE